MLETSLVLIGLSIIIWIAIRVNNSQPIALNNQLNDIQNKIEKLAEVNKQTLDINQTVKELESILKVPKTRANSGEFLLQEQLLQVLPKESISSQFKFKNGNICDIVIHLRDDSILSIDSKFPLENFNKMINATNQIDSKQSELVFCKDIKNRINEIRDRYIRPDEGTLEFAFMYIPVESIYYHAFVQDDNQNQLYEYAFANKVIPVSPHSLLPYLKIVLFGLNGLKIEANALKVHQGLTDIQHKLASFTKTYQKAHDQLRMAQINFDDCSKDLKDIQLKISNLGNQTLPMEKE